MARMRPSAIFSTTDPASSGKRWTWFSLIPCRKRSGPGSPPSSTTRGKRWRKSSGTPSIWTIGTASPSTGWWRFASWWPPNTPVPRCARLCPRHSAIFWTSCSIPTTTRRTSSPITSTSSPPLSISTGRRRSSSASAPSSSGWPWTACTSWGISTTGASGRTTSSICSWSITAWTSSGATTTSSGWAPRQGTRRASPACSTWPYSTIPWISWKTATASACGT